MAELKLYSLPPLPYAAGALAPHISEAQLTLHHTKHHQAYVNGANALLEKMAKARKENADFDVKAALKELSFHAGGYLLHALFWENMAPAGKGGGGVPKGELAKAIEANFGSFERFKKEFTATATGVEGSGWAALCYCGRTDRLLLVQIEKHNVNVIPAFRVLMVLDVWEHAYYLDYKNDRGKFVDAFWSIVNWEAVAHRYAEAVKGR
ncbi:MAG: superoxide dismutase [Methanomicrobiales archaeon]|nr:superoxide dismutase [Methanomicrobiales archaeon]